jgi:hypothetical protein
MKPMHHHSDAKTKLLKPKDIRYFTKTYHSVGKGKYANIHLKTIKKRHFYKKKCH